MIITQKKNKLSGPQTRPCLLYVFGVAEFKSEVR